MKTSTLFLIIGNAAFVVVIGALAIFISQGWWYVQFLLVVELIAFIIYYILKNSRIEESKELRKEEIIKIFNKEAKEKGYHVDFHKGNVFPAPREKIWKGELFMNKEPTFTTLYAVATNDGFNAEVTTKKEAWIKMVYDLSADPNDYDMETVWTTDGFGRPQQITRRLKRETKKEDKEWEE